MNIDNINKMNLYIHYAYFVSRGEAEPVEEVHMELFINSRQTTIDKSGDFTSNIITTTDSDHTLSNWEL